MKNKIIDISANVEVATDIPPFAGCKRIKIFDEYISSVIAAGGIPIILPVTTDKEVLDKHLELIDGLIISGGYDIDPLRYNEEPHKLLQATCSERDEFEFYLAKKAIEKSIPLLGICRGHQIINVVNGGSLYQDISLKEGTYINHVQSNHGTEVSHTIDIDKTSMLYSILGETALVNSLHHLAIKDLAPGFKAVATSKDGVIEAIEKIDGSFVMGVQWHPEALSSKNDSMLNIFKYLINSINK